MIAHGFHGDSRALPQELTGQHISGRRWSAVVFLAGDGARRDAWYGYFCWVMGRVDDA